jgi:hypothetical protein
MAVAEDGQRLFVAETAQWIDQLLEKQVYEPKLKRKGGLTRIETFRLGRDNGLRVTWSYGLCSVTCPSQIFLFFFFNAERTLILLQICQILCTRDSLFAHDHL